MKAIWLYPVHRANTCAGYI